RRLARFGVGFGLAVLGLLVLAWLSLHWFILPHIDDWRPQLERRASSALGVPVRIGTIRVNSSGWMPSVAVGNVELLDMQQRVALARCLANDPEVILMDEPLGALDALTRRNLQDELLRIWSELKKTILFVTHSIEEAIYLADRIVVMTYRPGTIKRDMLVELARPRDPASAEFNALKRELGMLVMEEQQRHHSDELRLAAVD
ncbi:MAG: hypothetical protein ACLGI6_05520, partial [Gammaproteobacteria bacterium]